MGGGHTHTHTGLTSSNTPHTPTMLPSCRSPQRQVSSLLGWAPALRCCGNEQPPPPHASRSLIRNFQASTAPVAPSLGPASCNSSAPLPARGAPTPLEQCACPPSTCTDTQTPRQTCLSRICPPSVLTRAPAYSQPLPAEGPLSVWPHTPISPDGTPGPPPQAGAHTSAPSPSTQPFTNICRPTECWQPEAASDKTETHTLPPGWMPQINPSPPPRGRGRGSSRLAPEKGSPVQVPRDTCPPSHGAHP